MSGRCILVFKPPYSKELVLNQATGNINVTWSLTNLSFVFCIHLDCKNAVIMQIYAHSKILHVLDGSGIIVQLTLINREAEGSHTGLAAFSAIYEKQMSQN